MATSSSVAFPGHRGSRHNCSTQGEPQPQPTCSPASQDPSPHVDGEMGLLPPGAEVEVRLDGKGYYGVWSKATVVEFTADQGRHAPGRYTVTFNGRSNRRFASTHVRPPPPALQPVPCFRPHDIVEALHQRGWWSGIVLSANPSFVTVAFPITRDVNMYMPHLVRPKRDYVDGDWVPSRAVVAVAVAVAVTVGPKRDFRRYEVRELVEAVREGKMWIPAKVAKVINEFSYIVEYTDDNGEEGGSSEYLHWQFIRPAVQDLPVKKEFKPRTSAKRQANFKQELASGKRAKAHAQVPLNGIGGAEYSENPSLSNMETPLSAPEICLTRTCPPNSCFPLSGHSTHQKIVVSDNVQNQLERKKAMCSKVCTSRKRLGKKKKGFEGPHSLHGPLEFSSMGEKIGVIEVAGSQREPSLVLERSEATQQHLDSTLENAVNPNEVKYPEPVGVVPLSFASTSDATGIHGSQHDEGLTAQDNRITDVLTNNSHTQAPFASCLLSAVEDMVVIKEFPQQPHFVPLQQYPETIQKGMKLGLKMAFNDCVARIGKSSIADSESSFEEKKSTLSELKKNGFDVEYLEGLLDKLIEVKDENNKHLEEKSAVKAEKQQINTSSEQKEFLLGEIENDIGELEKKLGLLRQKVQHIEKEKEHDEESLSALEVVERNIEEALDDDVRKFDAILAKAQQKRLI